ncbi:hypothetical protein [Mycobacterium sp.]|uniref:hypothetical protein n=1 Tax=Mycobacterium sp. TaxID=1785 RepID=UPI003A852C02
MLASEAMYVGRTEDREGFDAAVRLRLVEQDLDRHEAEFARLVAEMAGLRRVLTGILITLATSTVLLAVNVVVLRAGL